MLKMELIVMKACLSPIRYYPEFDSNIIRSCSNAAGTHT